MSIIKSGLLCYVFNSPIFAYFSGSHLEIIIRRCWFRISSWNKSFFPPHCRRDHAESIARREIEMVDSYLTWSTEPAVFSLPSAVTEVKIRIISLIPRRIGESLPVPRDSMVYVDGVNNHGIFNRLSWPPSSTGWAFAWILSAVTLE